MTTAVVLPGGGSMGAVGVGVLGARVHREVGLHGAFVAGPEARAATVVELERRWRSLRGPEPLRRPAPGALDVHR